MATGNVGTTEEKSTAASGSGSKGSGSGGGFVLILSIVNLVATVGILAMLFISFQRDKVKPSVEDISTRPAHEPEGEKPGAKEEEGKHGEHGGGHGEHGEGAKKKVGNYGRMITLDQFTVNLSTPGSVSAKFVRVNISLEVATEDAETELNLKIPQVRNTIIDLFNSKRPADLATADGRDYLKEEIRNALNSFMISGKVKGVYFTSFALSG